jgi:hypothetical protein
MGVIILLEGPDYAGKSTLAENIASSFDWPIQHEGPEPTLTAGTGPGSLLHRYQNKATEAWAHAKAHGGVVLDRFAISEPVYADVFSRPDRLGPDGLALSLAALRSPRTLLFHVMCLPAWPTCLRGMALREDTLLKDPRMLHVAWSNYAKLAADRRRWDLIFDWASPRSTEYALDAIELLAKEVSR